MVRFAVTDFEQVECLSFFYFAFGIYLPLHISFGRFDETSMKFNGTRKKQQREQRNSVITLPVNVKTGAKSIRDEEIVETDPLNPRIQC